MSNKISDFRVSIRQLFLIGVVLGVPYGIIGLIWALTHNDHLADLEGIDKVFSFLGEIIAWPALVVSDVTLR